MSAELLPEVISIAASVMRMDGWMNGLDQNECKAELVSIIG